MRLFSRLPASLLILAALISLSLVAIQPFTRSQMLLSDDGALHLYRTIVLDHSLRYDHPIYPRFSSALAYGYGAPLFNYFSPFAYYLPRTLHLLGLSFVEAWLAAMALYLWIAAVGAFLLGRILTNATGGIITAVAYLYSPYLLYDAVSRGTITEVAGLAVLPFVLYGLTRLAKEPSPVNFLFVVISYSIFIPLHNIVTLHGSLLIAAYAVVIALASSKPLKTIALLASVGALSIGLTAFFWLPALGETGWIKLPAITAALPSLDVTRHLRDIQEVLAVPAPVDPRQQQAPIPITVSWVALITAGIGVGVSILTKQKRTQFAFWAVVLLVSLFMNTPASAWVWQQVPLLNYTQFAWRILGIASMALAVLCGLSVYVIGLHTPQSRLRAATLPGLVVGLVLYSLPFTYRPTQSLDAVNVVSAQNHERLRGEVALSSYSEYLPVWASPNLDPNALSSLWDASPVIPRWTNTDGMQIEQETWNGTSAVFQAVLGQEKSVTLTWLYMPHWKVRVNETLIPTAPNADGLLTFDLPAGHVNVFVEYALSELQQLGVFISTVSLGLLIVVFVVWSRSGHSGHVTSPSLRKRTSLLYVFTGVGLLAFKTAVVDQTNNLWHQTRWVDGYFNGALANIGVFNRELALLSSDIQTKQDNLADIVVTTYWTPLQPLLNDYGLLYSVRNQAGIEVARGTNYQPAGVDTSRWIVGLYLQDAIHIKVPDGTLPGRYDVFVAVYTEEALLPTVNAEGNPDRPEIKLGTVEIAPQAFLPSSPIPEDAVVLLTTPDLPPYAMEGSSFIANLEWLAGTSTRQDFQYRLRWEQGRDASLVDDWSPLAPEYPPPLWANGHFYRTPIRIYVPLFDSSGKYSLWIELATLDEQIVYEARLGQIEVLTPAREFTPPVLESVVSATWQNGIQLVAYEKSGHQLSLVWTTSQILSDDLRLFVHLIDSNDVIIDQQDEVPVNWTRPTTSWLPGEFITTIHVFDEEKLNTSIVAIGFYNPINFERAVMDTGTTAFRLPIVANGN